ncbi:MAG: potassium channel family protein [Corticimicrobacter sp.]|uniref:potassium channel family protein n=1 Tax=Corticimicrobacter sp. TaxID=2678536 RepID=UPI0032DB5F72
MTSVSPPARSRWHTLATDISSVMGIVLSLALVISMSVEAFTSPSMFERQIYNDIQLWVCLYFLAELFVMLCYAEHKGRYLLRSFPLLLLYIPYQSLFAHFAVVLSDETRYLLRLLPIVRGGVALVILTRMTIKNRINSLFVTYIVIFLVLCYFQILAFYIFEANINPLVKNYGDALWWAALTVTTLGSNIVPVTTTGKIATAVLAVIGMTTFPIFTVYITTLVQNLNRKQASPHQS